MDSNTLAMVGVAVVAIVLILLAVWFSKSRKRDLDKTIEEREARRDLPESAKPEAAGRPADHPQSALPTRPRRRGGGQRARVRAGSQIRSRA
ncbi:hypothetical protein [Bifidobacterium stellenboschense]|uniref:hypothetical protein n=1 Tax=Bifidobacterium stellenboschense TaxID=762211 RepID=UPI003B75C75C